MTLRKTFEGDLKKMELTWGTAKSEAKDRNLWRKKNVCIILYRYTQQQKKKIRCTTFLQNPGGQVKKAMLYSTLFSVETQVSIINIKDIE